MPDHSEHGLKKPKKVEIPKLEPRPIGLAETTKKVLKKKGSKKIKDGSAEGHKLTGVNQ